MEIPLAKSGSRAPSTLYRALSLLIQQRWSGAYFQVEKRKREKSAVRRHFSKSQPRGTSQRCSPDLSSLFQLSSCSDRGDSTDRLTAAAENVSNTMRAAKSKQRSFHSPNSCYQTPPRANQAATDRYEGLEQTDTGAPSVRSRRMRARGLRAQTPAGM